MDNAERIPKNFDVLYIVFLNFDNNLKYKGLMTKKVLEFLLALNLTS